MTDTHDFQDRGDTARLAAGIDGTAGDAQDVRHRFTLDEPTGGCLLCGLAPSYRKHIDRLLDCGLCYEEHGEEVHPHPECPTGSTESAVSQQNPDGSWSPAQPESLTDDFDVEVTGHGPWAWEAWVGMTEVATGVARTRIGLWFAITRAKRRHAKAAQR